MGYDLHITRRPSWPDKDGTEIALEEWLAVVNSAPELTWNELNKKTSPHMADWSGPGKYLCWLNYERGEIYTKNPTEEMVDKMVQIAKRLNAKVLGEEDEEYLGDRWFPVLEMDMTMGELTGRRVYRRAERR